MIQKKCKNYTNILMTELHILRSLRILLKTIFPVRCFFFFFLAPWPKVGKTLNKIQSPFFRQKYLRKIGFCLFSLNSYVSSSTGSSIDIQQILLLCQALCLHDEKNPNSSPPFIELTLEVVWYHLVPPPGDHVFYCYHSTITKNKDSFTC